MTLPSLTICLGCTLDTAVSAWCRTSAPFWQGVVAGLLLRKLLHEAAVARKGVEAAGHRTKRVGSRLYRQEQTGCRTDLLILKQPGLTLNPKPTIHNPHHAYRTSYADAGCYRTTLRRWKGGCPSLQTSHAVRV